MDTRPVESKSLKVGKSLKIGKKTDKIGKIGINFLLDFFRLFGNLLKRSVRERFKKKIEKKTNKC